MLLLYRRTLKLSWLNLYWLLLLKILLLLLLLLNLVLRQLLLQGMLCGLLSLLSCRRPFANCSSDCLYPILPLSFQTFYFLLFPIELFFLETLPFDPFPLLSLSLNFLLLLLDHLLVLLDLLKLPVVSFVSLSLVLLLLANTNGLRSVIFDFLLILLKLAGFLQSLRVLLLHPHLRSLRTLRQLLHLSE